MNTPKTIAEQLHYAQMAQDFHASAVADDQAYGRHLAQQAEETSDPTRAQDLRQRAQAALDFAQQGAEVVATIRAEVAQLAEDLAAAELAEASWFCYDCKRTVTDPHSC